MPPTFTPFLNLHKPGLGEETNQWGINVNGNFDLIDAGVKANNDGLAPITGMQSAIATLQGQVTTLQGQVSTLQSQVSTLQSQMTSANSAIGNLQNQFNTLNSNLGTTNVNLANLTSSFNTLNNYVHTTVDNTLISLQNQINAIPKVTPTAITIAEQDLNSGTMTGHWVTVHLDNGSGTVCTLAFGAGTGQQGDVIQLPSGMANYAWQPYCQSIAAEGIADPIEYFHVSRPAGGSLQINQASGSTSSHAFSNGVVLAGWSAMAYKRS